MTEVRTYSANDMARIYCEKCNGCGDCCHGMTDTIHLDPWDVHQLETHLQQNFMQLLDHAIALHTEDGLILPHLNFVHDACPFLGEDGRCRIHAFRPGYCRLFPLGRDYDAATRRFRYFIVDAGCDMPGKMKVRISKWLGIPDLPRYEQFVTDWHYFCKDVKRKIAETGDADYAARINRFLLTVFYVTSYAVTPSSVTPEATASAAPDTRSVDFYSLFYLRLGEARKAIL